METGRDMVIERQQGMEVLCACFTSSVSIKDRTVVRTFVKIERMPLTYLAG
jgi:hypothetical protein